MEQLHKRFNNEQIKDLIQRYLNKELKHEHIQQVLKIKRRKFFKLFKEYRANPQGFSVQYIRTQKTRSISPVIEKNILSVNLKNIKPIPERLSLIK